MTGYYLRDYADLASTPSSTPWWSLTFDLVVKLGIVIALIYLTMWVLRTYVFGRQSRRMAGGGVGGAIQVLATTPLAPNRLLYLVEVADRILVLGATGSSLSTLAEIREPAAIETLRKSAAGDSEEAPGFADHLRSLTEHIPMGGASSSLSDKIGELRSLAATLRRSTLRTDST